MSLERGVVRLPLVHDADRGAEARIAGVSGDLADLLAGAGGSSPYLHGLILREADWLRGVAAADPAGVVPGVLADLPDSADALGPALRQAKRRVALYVALADLGGLWSLEEVTQALTHLADHAVQAGLRSLLAVEIGRRKVPGQTLDDLDSAAGMAVLAMGKMGAHELNYSSDIDLISLFDESRHDPDDYAEVRAAFVRVTRRLAAMLSDMTDQGYVFRTDLRLRPDASVTPVCLSMEAAERYYESVGRTWERAAYIKARCAAGDLAAGAAFLHRLRPFVWRRHLDFAAIQDAHDMRLRIREHKGYHGPIQLPGHDMKLGKGGIREIEFFTQTRQLIAGGRDPDLQLRDTVGALAALAGKGWVPQDVAATLTEDYRFHREVEHRLQMIADQQTQTLPSNDEGFARLAALMGRDAASLQDELNRRLARVAELTEGFFAPQGAAPLPDLSPSEREIVSRWRSYPALRSPRAVEIFDRLRPDLLRRLKSADRPEEALIHLDKFLAGLPAGVQIFSLFEANPVLVDLIVDIAATAPALASYLGHNAQVLDAVIGGTFFADWPGAAALQAELTARLAAAEDYEAALRAARVWQKEWHFRIGVHHLRDLTGPEEAGRHYADLASAVVAALWPLVTADMTRRHGPAPGLGAVVIGMGSLGAGWLTSGSDLDLIVIYDADGVEMSTGKRPLASRPWYARLTQALVTALSAALPEGRLYEVDMRLRPSGRQGPVATSVQSFETYQQGEAWTWEHLALTRARTMAGPQALAARVEAFRRDLLAAPHDPAAVMADLAEMRGRIAAAKGAGSLWDVKAGPGGVQDIELLGQGLALIAGSPSRGTPAQLRAAARAGLLDAGQADRLAAIWRQQQGLRTGLRLLSDQPTDPADLGVGAAAMLARDMGVPAAEMADRIVAIGGEAAAIVVDVLARAGAAAVNAETGQG